MLCLPQGTQEKKTTIVITEINPTTPNESQEEAYRDISSINGGVAKQGSVNHNILFLFIVVDPQNYLNFYFTNNWSKCTLSLFVFILVCLQILEYERLRRKSCTGGGGGIKKLFFTLFFTNEMF